MMNDTWWVGVEQLDEDQKTIIELPLGGSHLIVGPPGSGKTNLLLLRANYMTLAGQTNILIIVFTKTLQDFITSGSEYYSFPSHKVKTCRKWQVELLYEYGEKVSLPEDFEEQRFLLIEKINSLIKARKLGYLYDAILLDESQDYTPEEIYIFKRLSKVLFAVTDHRQKIYPSKDSFEAIRFAVDEIHELRYHYRNGLTICRLADAIAKDSSDYEKLAPTSNYDEAARPSSVEHFRCPDLDEQARLIIKNLKIQLKAYPDELLSVVCPTREALLRIWAVVEESEIAKYSVLQGSDDQISLNSDERIYFCTLHAVKGLEARALHLGGCELLKKFQHQRNMAFTAVTRAKTSLTLYYSDSLPGYLEKALQSLQPLPDLPKIEDVFKRKK